MKWGTPLKFMAIHLVLFLFFSIRLTTDVQDFKSSFKICLSQGLRSITQTIGCVVSLYLISPSLTLYMAGNGVMFSFVLFLN